MIPEFAWIIDLNFGGKFVAFSTRALCIHRYLVLYSILDDAGTTILPNSIRLAEVSNYRNLV